MTKKKRGKPALAANLRAKKGISQTSRSLAVWGVGCLVALLIELLFGLPLMLGIWRLRERLPYGEVWAALGIPWLITFLLVLALLVGLALMYILGKHYQTYVAKWGLAYLEQVLPLQDTRLRTRAQLSFYHYVYGLHGPMFMVRDGIPIATYQVKGQVPRMKAVVTDGWSALVIRQGATQAFQVLGPGIHFLDPQDDIIAFVDLRAHVCLISPDETQTTLADGTPAGARIFLRVILEDFGTSLHAEATPEKQHLNALRPLWERVYNTRLEDLQVRKFPYNLGYGHPESILRVLRAMDPTPGTSLAWWTLAEEVAKTTWYQLAHKYSLDDLFPPTLQLHTEKGHQEEKTFAVLQQQFFEALTSPENPAFQNLLSLGLRVTTALLIDIELDDMHERRIYSGFLNPWMEYFRGKQDFLSQAYIIAEERGRYRAQIDWVFHIARLLETGEPYPHLYEALKQYEQGESRDDTHLLEAALSESLHLLLRAWEPLARKAEDSELLWRIQTLLRFWGGELPVWKSGGP